MKIPVINSYLLSQYYILTRRAEEVKKVEKAEPKEECKHKDAFVDEFRKGHTNPEGETEWLEGKWRRITCKDCGHSRVEEVKRLNVKA